MDSRAMLLLVLAGCSARPTFAGGIPGAVVPLDDAPSLTALCTAACNRRIMLGCGCNPKCQATPEELWCTTRAKTCLDVEACR